MFSQCNIYGRGNYPKRYLAIVLSRNEIVPPRNTNNLETQNLQKTRRNLHNAISENVKSILRDIKETDS
ncbi:hypothetical protein J6590_061859 [Homalodisca vitripennis]|nr:hypothetical protein J6590_061859 [Homalodisca vitripennis]